MNKYGLEEEKIYEYHKRGVYLRFRNYSWLDIELQTEKEMQNYINNLIK